MPSIVGPREMPTKGTARSRFTHCGGCHPEDRQRQVLTLWTNWDPHALLVGTHKGAAPTENRLAVLQGVTHTRLTWGPAAPLQGNTQEK